MKLHLSSVSNGNIKNIKDYIKSAFFNAYSAKISIHAQYLISLKESGSYIAALGLTSALDHPLFLEQYLDCDIESALSNKIRAQVGREGIVEVSSFTATKPVASYLLFNIMAHTLYLAGVEWVVFTATPEVLRIISSLGFTYTTLSSAHSSCIKKDQGEDWGSYYDKDPSVVACFLPGNIAHQPTMPSRFNITRYEKDMKLAADKMQA